jgi:predicted aspartyl protease
MFYCNYLLRQPAPSVGGDPIPFNSRPPQTSVANQRQQDVVPISRSGRNFTVNATFNGAMTLPFLVDSGAEVVAVPINVFRGLQQRGAIQESDIIDVGYMGNADGSSRKTIKFFIRELQVGRHIAHNVQALLLPAGSDLLLGQTFLGRFTWTLDARNQQLIITD